MRFVPGSILKRRLGGLAGLFFCHMGIYLGGGLVVHFSGERKNSLDAILRLDTLEHFGAGRTIFVHAMPKNPRHVFAICQEALRLWSLGVANNWNGLYDFAWRNCEDFTVSCFEVAYV